MINIDMSVKINGLVLQPLEGTYEVSPIPYNAFADRTAKSLRVDHLGKVWEISFSLPPNFPDSKTKLLYDATVGFVIPVEFYNPFLGKRMTTTFYNSPFRWGRHSRRLRKAMSVKLIGTEVI